ncbi:uncharacterized protein LOC130614472 [Hydractinia symbiolongicarpus]|uniref:uncharacterized protein LOC130614472 n=1 Tax=Hydractinia symbiolongicarpus TaxID=13093 RepID=UPI00254DF6F5|nr:uncharacterized protein LOC130614472 [Hydractinia symbiolongicarpus]
MPSCLAYGCSQTTGRVTTKKSFFMIPKPVNTTENFRAAQWLHNIGTGLNVETFPFGKNKVVCEDHFHPDCIKDDLKGRLTGIPSKRKELLCGAVPTIFKHETYESINMDGTTVLKRDSSLKRKMQEECLHTVKKLLSENKETTLSQTLPTSSCVTENSSTNQLGLTIDLCSNENESIEQRFKDIGIQCCIRNAVSNVAAQTGCEERNDFSAQFPEIYSPDTCQLDPTYKLNVKATSTPKKNIFEVNNVNILETTTDISITSLSLTADSSQLEDAIGEDKEYVPGNCSTEDDMEEDKIDLIKAKKFVVYESMLEQLFSFVRCPECNSSVTVEKSHVGTSMHCKFTCLLHTHVFKWNTQPLLGKLPAFNLLLSATIFFSGETYDRIRKPLEFAGMNFINHTTFYSIQRTLVIPTVNKQFQECIKEARLESNGTDNAILGDGRFDSPGKSAKYCTYSCQSPTTKKIIATSTIQVSKGKGSAPLLKKIKK